MDAVVAVTERKDGDALLRKLRTVRCLDELRGFEYGLKAYNPARLPEWLERAVEMKRKQLESKR